MVKTRSRQPAYARPVRRSLVELTAAAVSNAAHAEVHANSPTFEDLQNPKVCNVSASPGDVKDIVSPELQTGPAVEEPATQEASSRHGTVISEKTTPAAIPATIADYQAKAFGLTEANISATLEYAQQLANLRSASDFIKLSSRHARIQIELMIKQSSELRSFAMNLTPSYDTLTAADPQVLTKSTDRL